MNFDAVASPALARTHLGARTICIHAGMTCFGIPATSGIAAPHLGSYVYSVSGSKPRTASNRGLVENLIEAPVISLATENSRPLLSHAFEVDSPADQLQQLDERLPRDCLRPQVTDVHGCVDLLGLNS